MKRVVMVVLATILLLPLTGCGRLTDGIKKDLGWVVEKEPSMFPEGMCDGGEEIFGNGKSEDENDIFTVIERKIWGDQDDK